MIGKRCTHKEAESLLASGEFEAALRVAGPMLKHDPADLTAWRIASWALLELGERETAITNLRSLSLALAEARRPILGLAHIKEMEALGEDVDDLIVKFAALYGADSDRLVEAELAPPPIPASAPLEPWGDQEDRDSAVRRAKEAVAVSWGQSLTAGAEGDLPFIPLLSVLPTESFASLVKLLEREVYQGAETIVDQGSVGDAMYIVAQGAVEIVRTGVQGVETKLATLGPGAFFGEMALVSSAPRAAQVRALERAVVLRADKQQMEDLAERAKEIGEVLIAFCHARMLQNLLRVSPVLALVPPTLRPEVLARFSTDYRSAGSVVVEEGKIGEGLFLIVSGRMQVVKGEGDDRTVLANLGSGDVFGEISLIMGKLSTASVVAIDDSALLFLSSTEFHAATKDYPQLLKGAFDIALAREAMNNSILASKATSADELILL